MYYSFENGEVVKILNEDNLFNELNILKKAEDEQIALLFKNPKYFIRAKCDEGFWIVDPQQGNWWNAQILREGNFIKRKRKKYKFFRNGYWKHGRGDFDFEDVCKIFALFLTNQPIPYGNKNSI